jgi:hypothetical protein
MYNDEEIHEHPNLTQVEFNRVKDRVLRQEFRIHQGLAKVVFKDRIFKNGKNYIWIRLSRAYLDNLNDYWKFKQGFYYMKIYQFNRRTRVVGRQIAYITLDKYVMM